MKIAPNINCRLVLIGAFEGIPSEGLRRVSHSLRHSLEKICSVFAISTKDSLDGQTFKRIKEFNPQVIHYVPGPTRRGLFALSLLKRAVAGNPLTVASATRPFLTNLDRMAIRLLVPDLVLTQAPRWDRFFRKAGAQCIFIPNGVSRNRFSPCLRDTRERLRNKLGLDQHGKVVLHVGHIKRNRGLDCFKSLKSEGYTCLIVGSPDFSNETLSMELRKNGIRIITKYIPNIEEYYMASDCFLFPLMDLPMHSFPTKYNQMGVIDTPLSVLEAVSCGISVVTTDYGGLKKVLGERKGIVFWDGSPASLSDCLRDSMGNKPDESTVPDWDSVATGILNAYSEASFGL